MNPRLIVRGTTEQRSTVISRENLELPLFFDRCFDKNRIKTFIGWLLANFGENATVYVVEKLKNLGFYFATEAGISLSIDDLQIPSNKNQLLSQAEKDIKKNSNYFQCGNLTPVEQSQQLLDRWHRTSETLRESVIQSFRLTNTLNPVYMMAFSGARGNISQVRQLVGMRGLMADPQGQIISFPIRSNFREGLTLTEYIISCYGARKGVVDTALRTADSGYLTRRLVDVSQHVVVWTFDCKTDAGIHLTEMKEGRKTILSLKKRILGRVLAQEIPPIAFRNQQISAQLAQQIVSLKEHVLVRSPLSCSLPNSVCQLCYGWSLSRGRIVSLGEAVGVIAAQSIGEPGTQLTMRTFHTGGVFSGDVIDEIRAPHDGVVRFLHPLLGQLIRTSHGRIAYLTRANGSFVIEKNSKNSSPVLRTEVQSTQESVKSDSISEDIKRYADKPKVQVNTISQTIIALEPGTALFIRQGEKVVAKQLLAEYSSISAQTNERVEAQHQVYSDQKGEIFFDNVILGKKLKKEEPETEKESILNPLGVSDVDVLSGTLPQSGKVQSTQNKENSLQNKVKQGERLDQQSRRKIDIVTSLKLNTLWILSGTFFEPAVPSPLYVKIGDLVDKTTLLTVIQSKLNLQTSHLDGDYILSAQLKEDKILKKKEKLLTFFNKNLVSNQFSKNSQKETFFLQRRNWEDKIKKRESLFLNKFSLNLIITNIRYKKSGYFFTSYKKEKTPDFYSLFLQARSVNLFYNLTNLKTNKENNRLLNWDLSLNITDTSFSQTRGFKESKLKGNFSLGQGKTDFPGLLKSYTITKDKQKILAGNKSQNLFIFDIDVDGDLGVLTDLKKSPKIKDLWLRTRENLVTLKEIKRPSLFKEWSVLKRNKVENKKNVNHFFTTTALNQPFSNGREFKNEFILQSFAPRFKTETGGLIYTNNHYLNKRSTEAQIFFMAEQNYGKKNLGKMNFGMRKKSFHIVSFKELMTPSICLTNVALNGKNKPNSSFKNSLLSSSENLANALFTNKSVQIKGASNIADRLSFSTERFLQDKNARDNKVLFISSLLNKICFLQNQDFKKDIFLLRKKEDLNLYSAYFHSKKRKTSNSTINFLKKGFLSFKNKWVETDIPLGYQKNLQGSQIPFYSTENGVLRNNLASSFFTNQYSTYWRRRKRQKSSVSFLKPFLPLTYKSPSPYLQVKKRPLSVKNAFFINNLDLNQNKFFGESGNFIKNFNSRPIKERLYQKEFCLIDQQRKETILKETPAIGGVDKKSGLMQPLFYKSSRKPSFLHNKDRIRFSLAFLLQKCHLNFTRNKSFLFAKQKERGLDVLTGSKRKAPLSETTYRGNKRIPLKFNPFPSKGNSLSSAFTFEINLRAVQFCDFRKEGLLFYNSYPYPQPLFVEFLQNKSTADFYYLAKSLNIHFDLQKKHVLLQRKPVLSESSPLTLQKQIKKRFIKKHRKTDENLERSNLQVRPGWLYLPKNQLQTAQAHQSFTLPFQQNLDEILFDQFPVYIESILRKNFEEQLADKYLQPSTNTVDCGKANTFVEKSKLQKFINKIYPLYASSIPNTKEKRHKNHFLMRKERPNRFLLSLRETFWRGSTFSSVIENDFTTFSNKNKNLSKLSKEDLSYQTNLPTNSLNHTPISNTSLFISFLLRNKKKRKTNYLRDKKVFPVQSTEVQSTQNVFDADLFSKTEKKETQNKGQQHTILQPFNQTGNENIINEKDNIIDKSSSDQTSEYFEFHSKNPLAKPIESLPNSSSQKEEFSLDRKEIFSSAEHRGATHPRNSTLKFKGETKEPNIGNISPQPVYKKEKEKEKFLFLRTVSINPIKIGFQVVTNKSSRFNSIQSFALSCVNDIDFGFSQNFFLQSQIITKDLSQTQADIYIKRNPKSFFCLPQISRIYFVKNKPFSDFVLVSRKFTFDRQTFSENQDNVDVLSETEKKETLPHTFLQGKNISSKVESTKNSQEGLIEKVRLSEKNKNLLCKEKQILVNTNEKPNKYKNLPKILQNKALLIQNFSPKVDTNYFSFLVLIPTFLKESANTATNTVNTTPLSETQNKEKDSQKKTYDFPVQTIQKRKYSFSTLFCQKSKLWLLIRQAAEYPLLDTPISQQKTKLHQANQPFFEKELTYSSTPLSLYMSNRVIFSSKFNKQKRDEICLSFYNSPKVNLKIRENTFHLLRAFSQLEKQDFANLSEHFVKQNVDSSKTKFLQGKNLKLPHNLFSCQKVFWNLFGLHYQNLQKNKLFERKEPLFIKKTFDIEEKDSLTENLSFKSDFGVDVLSETEKKEIQNNKGTLFSQTHIKSGENVYKGQEDKGNHLLFNGEEKGFPNKTWFFQKEIANIPQARQLDGLKNNEIEHFDNQNVLATKYRETLEDIVSFQEKEETIIRSFKQSYLLDFLLNFTISKQSPLQRLEIKTTFEKIDGNTQISSCTHCVNLQGFEKGSRKKDNSDRADNLDFVPQNVSDRKQKNEFFPVQSIQNWHNVKIQTLRSKGNQNQLKSWQYSFTPFARDLSFTLSFTAKLNQSWFFSLATNVKNKLRDFSLEERKSLTSLQSSIFQNKEVKNQPFIGANSGFAEQNQPLVNQNRTKQKYLKDKKLFSKQNSSYPLKERNSYTTLLLDQTLTISDKTPVATTALISREEGEIENIKSDSACLILRNSDIEILLTKGKNPIVVVGQLIRYGEEIANGVAAPKSGQIIQVDTNKVTLRKAQPILFPRGGSIDVSHGDYVKEGSPLLSLSYQRLVTGDIVQGIPKIEQLFEARETEGGQPLLSNLHNELEAIFLSYRTQLGLRLAVRESFKDIQQIIVDRVQRVYIAQGVLIADKHFEVVIRQMTSKVRILDGGRPGFLYGELVDLRRVELLNAGVPFSNEQAIYEPIILGISKACLEAEGFLSPASFQETTRVLSLAAIERKTDFLRGIKERVILGDVIQAGTGFTLYDRPVRKIKQEKCIDLSLSVLQNAHSTLSSNQYYKQL